MGWETEHPGHPTCQILSVDWSGRCGHIARRTSKDTSRSHVLYGTRKYMPLARPSRNVWNPTGPDRTPGARGGRRNRSSTRGAKAATSLANEMMMAYPTPTKFSILSRLLSLRAWRRNGRRKKTQEMARGRCLRGSATSIPSQVSTSSTR
jgi:hypothetical protein